MFFAAVFLAEALLSFELALGLVAITGTSDSLSELSFFAAFLVKAALPLGFSSSLESSSEDSIFLTGAVFLMAAAFPATGFFSSSSLESLESEESSEEAFFFPLTSFFSVLAYLLTCAFFVSLASCDAFLF